MTCDVVNEYLNAPCQQNIWFVAGTEHRPKKTGKLISIVRDLYELNSSVVVWIKMFADKLRDMDFVPTVADPDVYHS